MVTGTWRALYWPPVLLGVAIAGAAVIGERNSDGMPYSEILLIAGGILTLTFWCGMATGVLARLWWRERGGAD